MTTKISASRLRRLVATAMISAFASSFAVVSAAADDPHTVSAVVKYGDLNVSNPEGAATLYWRIAAAARAVCGSTDNASRDLASAAGRSACIRQAIADAVTRVGRPELFAIYNTKNREPLPITVAAVRTR